jgi:quinoprotein glucose dehydrogenase
MSRISDIGAWTSAAVHESDVCIIGGGVSAAMLAEKLSELKPGLAITIVEAGSRIFDLENRAKYRERSLEYGENAWPGDFIDDQAGAGIISRRCGGEARCTGAASQPVSEEDLTLKSRYAGSRLADRWRI